MNQGIYLNSDNALDEIKGRVQGIPESSGEEGSDGLQSKKGQAREGGEDSSFKLLADSIPKFSEIYDKIENNKRQQMFSPSCQTSHHWVGQKKGGQPLFRLSPQERKSITYRGKLKGFLSLFK
ncbi:hypothetical protein E2542_SST14405 [Spatholobus suberectus]|nr:hypothetical protein E2542_SST14405 [Spatholobus suberectus]